MTTIDKHLRHAWRHHDSSARSKTCERCQIRVDRFGVGRRSYYVWSYSADRRGDTQDGTTVPPCPGYPPVDNAVVTIPIAPDSPTTETLPTVRDNASATLVTQAMQDDSASVDTTRNGHVHRTGHQGGPCRVAGCTREIGFRSHDPFQQLGLSAEGAR